MVLFPQGRRIRASGRILDSEPDWFADDTYLRDYPAGPDSDTEPVDGLHRVYA